MNSNLNYDNLPINIEGNESDQISKYTIKQSKERLDKVSNLFIQHLGKNWKFILFLISIFIIFMAILIRYGLNMYSTHNNLFLSIFILSIFTFTIWIIILPEKDTRIFGIVPFPKDSPYIPVDSSQCGLSPTKCDINSDCDTKCGSDKYTCTDVSSKDVFYLGTQLNKDKALGDTKFCLPEEGIQKINECGTYTGRAVWSSNKDGQYWKCKCIYPELYNGDTCTDKVDEHSNFCLKGSTGSKCWDRTNMPPELVDKTPYDTDMEIVCDKGYNFYGGSCQKDICLNGEEHSPVAQFDNETKKCVCKPQTFQSNISGLCLTDTIGKCNPHPITNKCMYDIDIGGVTKYALFTLNGIPYLSFSITDPDSKSDPKPYPILVDVSKSNLLNSLGNPRLTEMNTSVLKDAFYAFPIKPFEKLTTDQQTNISNIKSVITDAGGLSDLFSKKEIPKVNESFGVAEICNSFYYKNEGKPNCKNMLSITGTDYKQFITENLQDDCGAGSVRCDFNLNSSNGKNCKCGDGQNLGGDGRCKNCLPSGTDLNNINNPSLCCSGKVESIFVCDGVGGKCKIVGYKCKQS